MWGLYLHDCKEKKNLSQMHYDDNRKRWPRDSQQRSIGRYHSVETVRRSEDSFNFPDDQRNRSVHWRPVSKGISFEPFIIFIICGYDNKTRPKQKWLACLMCSTASSHMFVRQTLRMVHMLEWYSMSWCFSNWVAQDCCRRLAVVVLCGINFNCKGYLRFTYYFFDHIWNVANETCTVCSLLWA